jgi:hypothetical protein
LDEVLGRQIHGESLEREEQGQIRRIVAGVEDKRFCKNNSGVCIDGKRLERRIS